MKRKLIPLLLSIVVIASLVLVGCAPKAAPPEEAAPPPEEEEAPPAAPEEEAFSKTWTMISPLGKNYMTDLYYEWASTITKQSGERLKVDVHIGGELGYEGPEHLEVIEQHLVDVIEFRPFWSGGTEPYGNVTGLPYVGTTFGNQHTEMLLTAPHMQEILSGYNAKILLDYCHGGTYYWSKEKVTSIEDFKNVKARVCSELELDTMTLMGANAFFMPWGDVYTGLQRGVMDAVLTSGMSAVEASFWEVLSYGCPLHNSKDAGCLIVHTDAWDELPADIKVIVLEASRETERKLWLGAMNSEAEADRTMEEHGVTIYELPTEIIQEMRERSRPIWDDWAQSAGPEGDAFIEAFLAYADR